MINIQKKKCYTNHFIPTFIDVSAYWHWHYDARKTDNNYIYIQKNLAN